MKSLLIQCDAFYPKTNATAKRMLSIAKTFVNSGWNVAVITLSNADEFISNKETIRNIDGIDVHYFYSENAEAKGTKLRLKRNIDLYKSGIYFAKKHKKDSYEFILTTSPELLPCLSGLKLKKVFKAKWIFDVRDIWPDVAFEMGSFGKRSFFGIAFNYAANMIYRKCDIITTVSSSKVESLKSKNSVKQKDKVILIENGFDESMLDLHEDDTLCEKLSLSEGFVISFLGNVGMAQGLDNYVKLAKTNINNKDMRFLIVGDGKDKKRLQEMAANEQISNIEFYDPVDQNGVFTLLRHTKIGFVSLVSSNLKNSIPTKLYENLGMGVPTLLLAAGDSTELIEETGLGLHSAPEDEKKMINNFNYLYTHFNEFECKIDACKKRVLEKHSRKSNSIKLLDYLNNY